MKRFIAIAALGLVVAACTPGRYPGTADGLPPLWHTLSVENRHRTDVVLYPELSGTVLWSRIARIPAHSRRTVRIPASYLNREFGVVVCRSSGWIGAEQCARSDRYRQLKGELQLVVFSGENLRSEIR
jgi:hypothetical protein